MEFESSLTFSQKSVAGINSEQGHSSSYSHALCTYFLWQQAETSKCVEWLGCGVDDRESGFDFRDGHCRLYCTKGSRSVIGCWVHSQSNINRIVWFVTEKFISSMFVCMYICTVVSQLLASCWHGCEDTPLMRSPVFAIHFKPSHSYCSCERTVNVLKALERNEVLPDVSGGGLVTRTQCRFEVYRIYRTLM
jgi:hypothetical protein